MSFIKNNKIFVKCADCLEFLNELPDNSVDLILTDPPFGLGETFFDNKLYARKDKKVIAGYVEAPKNLTYEDWCYKWISKFDRVLKKNGSVLIFSGWTYEADLQYAIRRTNKFKIINHLIWHYNFGVYTSKKFVTSHYHILYFCKKNGKPFFNQYAYHNEDFNKKGCGSEMYKDLQDVIKINREYKPNKTKNSNTLPIKLIEKLIKHTTKPGDVVLDIFSGGFTTEFAALKLKRKAWGCEINKESCEYYLPLLKSFNKPYTKKEDYVGFERSLKLINQGKPLAPEEKTSIIKYFNNLKGNKKDRLQKTAEHFKRGFFSISRIIHR